MNARILITLACSGAVLPTAAVASPPPVKVEVIVDGDDEGDFFDESTESGRSARSKTGAASDRSAGMFEELDGQESGVRVRTVKPPKSTDGANENTSTQVVNVIVQGRDEKNTAPAAEPEKPAPAPEAAAVAEAPAAPAVMPADDCNCSVEADGRLGWWWGVPNHIQEGDVLLSVSGGWGSAGGMGGLRLEGLLTSRVGLQLNLRGTGFSQQEVQDEDDRTVLSGDEWGLGDIDPNSVNHGFAHMVDLGFSWHMFRKSRLDVFPSLGVGHFGYNIDLRDAPNAQGGSVLLKVGIGFNYHWRRFFFGFDFSWYPYEMLRYQIVEDEEGDRGAESVDVEDRFNEKRFISSAFVGLRF